ncbi:NAD(P) transhydrogenase subunit alpha [Streptomyces hesseae]|uniref:proton-translocating NAD(P)(+) transhydrogenase n=1 Tax=Streptomyces hesseae TaxID=3075519 RepID=A0ABU2SLQ4_9ACTN|nr:NAD(P) transhydrogenase subunit alpha [Streptomyces sp. DSM 40473]MDT0449566.1 NAD(P) transhydrogenase subunit alpha [Streptomyces sp. DSM 40473]
MTGMTLGVCKETVPGERRVALVPESVASVEALGLAVVVESGAGAQSWRPDDLYRKAGAGIVTPEELIDRSDIVVGVRPPNLPVGSRFRRRQIVMALLDPLHMPFRVRDWADAGVTSIGLDLAPQTSVLARRMDAVASQGRLAGYKAALLAADRLDRPLPDTVPTSPGPARVLVLGSGDAAREAAGTLRRLGAEVRVRDDVLPGPQGAGEPGPGPLTGLDVLITAVRPRRGRPPPLLVTARDLAGMGPGSVVVDTAVGPDGGNVEGARPERSGVVGPGVTLIGAGRLPEDIPVAASAAYARNVIALLDYIVRDGDLWIDPDDPVQDAMTVTHDGFVHAQDVWQLILDQTAVAGMP